MSIDIGDRESRIPLWAALGAPLVGVPLLVALLALGTSGPEQRGDRIETGPVPADIEAESTEAAVDVTIALEESHG